MAAILLSKRTGATGLEPATSGVTGWYVRNRHGRLPPWITGWSRDFAPARTGCDRLRPAAARQSVCSTCVVGLVSDQATKQLRGRDLLLTMEVVGRYSWRSWVGIRVQRRAPAATFSISRTPM